jgi:hypothetical protein
MGVNVLVGVPNTGKSKWLRMIDYLFGDDKKPAEALEEAIANKYESVRAAIMLGAEEWIIERNWKEPALATKITVNGELMTLHSFTTKLMGVLQIPVLRYPQGNPYSPRAWPELGWRSLYRHMYRRQGFWTDLVDKQPESEQHACILQFVGIAEILFSEQYGKMVALEKKIEQLQSSREQFVAMLQEVSRELIDEKELGVALTPDSIAVAVQRLQAEIAAAQQKRQTMLGVLLDDTLKLESDDVTGPSKDMVEQLGQELAELRVREEAAAVALRRTNGRIAELRKHRELIAEELGRMQRAMEGGLLLADLKITNCPVCDRPVEREVVQSGLCYLCKRHTDESSESKVTTQRLEFELEQLKDELKETDQLLVVLAKEADRLSGEHARGGEQITRVQTLLRPVSAIAAFLLPPELAILDQETGRLQERIAQLKRVEATLGKRETIAADIERIQAEVATLEAELAVQSKNVRFERGGDLLTDGMNTYLNAINELKPNSWSQQEVDFVLQDRTFAVRIGKANWQIKLGGTLTLFFMVAYHYALMTLTGKDRCHYPGFCILDFPAQLDGVTVSDSENFVLEPFLQMMKQPDQPARQIIAAGSSFAGLAGAHRIELTKVWA